MTGALDGVRIVDFGRVLAAPYATMLLADLGADVVKVERPGVGDETRGWGPPFADGESTYFRSVNRNKRSVALDLSVDADLEVARNLVRTADVVVENFRPGTMERYGLGYDQLRAADPGIVYCSVTGFGRGAGADLPGYDLLVQAVGGLMSVTGEPGGDPMKVGVALVDVVTGLHATVGILAALRHRERTGEGQRVDATLLTSALSAMVNQVSAYVGAGVVPTAMGNRHPSITPYELVHAADRPFVVAVGNDRQFAAFAGVLGRPGLAADERFVTNVQRVRNRDDLVTEVEALLADRTAAAWVAEFTAAGVPAGAVNSIAEALDLADGLGLDPVVQIDDPRRASPVGQVAHPVRLSATPPTYRVAPPQLDEDGPAVRAEVEPGSPDEPAPR